jgi:hypothetical protein
VRKGYHINEIVSTSMSGYFWGMLTKNNQDFLLFDPVLFHSTLTGIEHGGMGERLRHAAGEHPRGLSLWESEARVIPGQ